MPNAIDMMRTVAWFRECCSEAGVDTAYALEKRFDELAMMDGSGDAMTRSEPRTFSQYADGSVLPSTETLAAVEAVLPSTREVFDMGPKTEDGYAPLWLGVAGDTECRRRSKSEPPCRPNIEPGVGAGLQRAGGG